MESLLINAIDTFFRLLYFLIFIRIIISWIPGLSQNPVGDLLFSLTEPILGPVRHWIDKSPIGGGMMLDFSPVIALFLMQIISVILKNIVVLVF